MMDLPILEQIVLVHIYMMTCPSGHSDSFCAGWAAGVLDRGGSSSSTTSQGGGNNIILGDQGLSLPHVFSPSLVPPIGHFSTFVNSDMKCKDFIKTYLTLDQFSRQR